jgi:hypothetical protein
MMIHALLTMCLSAPAGAAPEPQAAQLPPVALKDLDLLRSWFKPMPAKDGDPICSALAADARRYFRSAGEWSQYATAELAAGTGLVRVPHPSEDSAQTAVELRGLPDDPAQLILDRPNQPRVFLYFSAQSDCDSPCKGQRLILSDQRIMRGESNAQLTTAQTPEADAWTLYRAPAGSWYAAGIVDQHLQLYAVTTPQQWRLACDMALSPYRLRNSLDPAARTALAAVDALHSAAQALGGEARADCRRGLSVQTLEQSLYRPWQWLDGKQGADYRQLLMSLEESAASGTDQRAALERYTAQIAASTDAVQRFYTRKFGWNTQVATRVAYDALTGAIGSGLAPMASRESSCVKDVAGF